MPELPEVETIRRQLCHAGLEGSTVRKVVIRWNRTVDPVSPAAFRKKLTGRTFLQPGRHGKWLLFPLDGPESLFVHLRMTGAFYFSEGPLKAGPHDRLILVMENGPNLHYRDPRKFGRWRMGSEISGLGPDALQVSEPVFTNGVRARSRVLKGLLLDQGFVAGIGNIYADEALYAARIHPLRKSDTLTAKEASELHHALKRILKEAVRNKGMSLGDGAGNFRDLNGNAGGYRQKAQVYGRGGEPCLRCRESLEKITVAQRTTVFCARCAR